MTFSLHGRLETFLKALDVQQVLEFPSIRASLIFEF